MNIPSLSTVGKAFADAVSEHSSGILIGFGIAGFVASTVMAVKATPKALELMEKRKEELEVEELTPVETVKTTWKCYALPVLSTTLSIACVLGAKQIDMRRNAALATAYGLSEQALRTYQQKVVETIGENKERKIREEVIKDRIRENPPTQSNVIITGTGKTLCYIKPLDKYFEGDIDKVKKAEHVLNSLLRDQMFVSVNDLYEQLGLRCFTELGDDLGWNIDEYPIEFQYSSHLAENDRPAFAIDFTIGPKFDYRELH